MCINHNAYTRLIMQTSVFSIVTTVERRFLAKLRQVNNAATMCRSHTTMKTSASRKFMDRSDHEMQYQFEVA